MFISWILKLLLWWNLISSKLLKSKLLDTYIDNTSVIVYWVIRQEEALVPKVNSTYPICMYYKTKNFQVIL